MPHMAGALRPAQVCVDPEFDNLKSDTEAFVRLVHAGHVFGAWDVFVGGERYRVAAGHDDRGEAYHANRS